MLFEAAFWRRETPRLGFEQGRQRPDLAKLLDGWGRAGDTAVVAESESRIPLGAAWFRFWSAEDHSYGFVSPAVPELGIAVRDSVRGRGVGTRVLRALRAEASRQGIAQISLSVEPDNPALRLYERVGFRKLARVGGAWTMLAAVEPMPPETDAR